MVFLRRVSDPDVQAMAITMMPHQHQHHSTAIATSVTASMMVHAANNSSSSSSSSMDVIDEKHENETKNNDDDFIYQNHLRPGKKLKGASSTCSSSNSVPAAAAASAALAVNTIGSGIAVAVALTVALPRPACAKFGDAHDHDQKTGIISDDSSDSSSSSSNSDDGGSDNEEEEDNPHEQEEVESPQAPVTAPAVLHTQTQAVSVPQGILKSYKYHQHPEDLINKKKKKKKNGVSFGDSDSITTRYYPSSITTKNQLQQLKSTLWYTKQDRMNTQQDCFQRIKNFRCENQLEVHKLKNVYKLGMLVPMSQETSDYLEHVTVTIPEHVRGMEARLFPKFTNQRRSQHIQSVLSLANHATLFRGKEHEHHTTRATNNANSIKYIANRSISSSRSSRIVARMIGDNDAITTNIHTTARSVQLVSSPLSTSSSNNTRIHTNNDSSDSDNGECLRTSNLKNRNRNSSGAAVPTQIKKKRKIKALSKKNNSEVLKNVVVAILPTTSSFPLCERKQQPPQNNNNNNKNLKNTKKRRRTIGGNDTSTTATITPSSTSTSTSKTVEEFTTPSEGKSKEANRCNSRNVLATAVAAAAAVAKTPTTKLGHARRPRRPILWRRLQRSTSTTTATA